MTGRATCAFLVGALALLAGALGQEDPRGDAAAVDAAVRAAVARVAASVVEVEALGGLPEEFKAPSSEDEAEGGVLAQGGFKLAWGPSTGVVIRADGLILTSTFPLQRQPRHLFVTLADGRTLVARPLGRDLIRGVQLLRVAAEGLPALELAPRAEVRVGQVALALGRGLGTRELAVSRGIVSALERVGGVALQSNAAISPVNYGGPLIDLRGRMMGLLVPLSLTGGMPGVDVYDSGIGFAAYAEDLRQLLPRLVAGEELRPPFLGLTPAAEGDGEALGVNDVVAGAPADRAGLRAGDRVLALGGEAVRSPWDLRRALRRRAAGDTVKVEVQRADKRFTVEVLLGEVPEEGR